MTRPSDDELRAWTKRLQLDELDPWAAGEDRYVELVDAGRAAVDELMAVIDLADTTTTQLLSGPSGSGKSTELNRLRGDLRRAGFEVLIFDVESYVNRSAPVYITEFLIALALGAHDALGPRAEVDRPGFLPRLRALLAGLKISLEVPGFSASASGDGVELEALGATIEVDLKRELKTSQPFVTELRSKLRYNVGELYVAVSGFIDELLGAEDPGRGWVVIVDGLEKLRGVTGNEAAVQQAAEELFVQHAAELSFTSHHTVYTVPTYLRFTSSGALPYDGRVKQVPSPHVRPRPGETSGQADRNRAQLHRAVALRVPVDRIFADPAQLDRMVLASGGHLRVLFSLLRQLVNLVKRRSLELPLADAYIDEAVDDVAHDFTEMTAESLAFLTKVAEAKDGTVVPPADEVALMARLLSSAMLLGHANGKDWYEVHPLTRRALDPP